MLLLKKETVYGERPSHKRAILLKPRIKIPSLLVVEGFADIDLESLDRMFPGRKAGMWVEVDGANYRVKSVRLCGPKNRQHWYRVRWDSKHVARDRKTS